MSDKVEKFRSRYHFNSDDGIDFDGIDSVTDNSLKDTVDINCIVQRYGLLDDNKLNKLAQMTMQDVNQFNDVSQVPSLDVVLDEVKKNHEIINSLPVGDEFTNQTEQSAVSEADLPAVDGSGVSDTIEASKAIE